MTKAKKIGLFLTVVWMTIGIFSCDIIDENDRHIPIENPPMEQLVLLENFTGQKCVNCPTAEKEIALLKEIYKENLIVVNIHAGSFSLSALRTDAGDAYFEYFKPEQFPSGMVNRKKENESYLFHYQNYDQAIRKVVWMKPEIYIELNTQIDNETINVDARLQKSSIADEDLSLELLLVEDSIRAIQFMPDGSRDRDYVHNHTLRAAMYGGWGKTLEFVDNKATMHGSIPRNDTWKITNCHVIAFAFDTENKEIKTVSTIQLN